MSPETVSIIIPCRNEEQYIGRCLDSILKQNFPAQRLDVFVADGLSIDQTREIIQTYADRDSRIHLLVNEEQTTSFGLNLGIKNSKSDVIIILGAHAELLPDYVSECLAVLNGNPHIGCSGGILENVCENEAAETIGLAMSSGFGVGNAHFRTGNKEGSVDTVAFGAYKRIVFEKAGLFDTELVRCQDDEFNYRVIKSGFEIHLSNKIRCRYFVRASYSKLLRQYYQYGYWKVYAGKKHKAVTTLRQLVPLLFILYLLGGIAAGLILPELLPLYLVGLSIYIGASLGSAIRASKKLNQILPVMGSFFILHFSYGLGYLIGIFHFILLNRKVKSDARLSR